MKIIIKGILICFMSILSFTPVFAEETNLNTIPDDKLLMMVMKMLLIYLKKLSNKAKNLKS